MINDSFKGRSAGEIYAVLEAEKRKPEEEQVQPGGVEDAAPDHEPAEQAAIEAEWRTMTAQAIAVAKAANAGRVPGYLERLVEQQAAPKIDWRDALRQFVDSTSRADYLWTRPNRRFVGSGLWGSCPTA